MLVVFLSPAPIWAASQTMPTNEGTLNVSITYDTATDPDTLTKVKIDFINPVTQQIQEHIDYNVTVTRNNNSIIFGPTGFLHTSAGSVKIPVEFDQEPATYSMDIIVEGILFQPIPAESVSFDIVVSDAAANGNDNDNDNNGGGCLIATAAFGSELVVQVQQLREFRDNTVLNTATGMAFMTAFNQLYYSFSPAVADLQREHPAFKEAVRVMLTPMLSSLHLLDQADINSEEEMFVYGISIILLNAGLYIGIPASVVFGLYHTRKRITSVKRPHLQ